MIRLRSHPVCFEVPPPSDYVMSSIAGVPAWSIN
jgi:hypothetical protein